MAMRRVPPGTIPKYAWEDQDSLSKLYEQQQREIDRSKRLQDIDLVTEMQSGRVKQFSRPLVRVPKEERENIERYTGEAKNISFSGRRPDGYWGRDPEWQALSSYEKAAAMALLEADSKDGKPDFAAARNALGAMINRADKEGQDLGEHVSRKIYQPTIEPEQYARLQSIIKLPQFKALTGLAEARDSGQVEDWVGGATHFLAKPDVMLKLEAGDPEKYKSWRKWTGFDEATGKYQNEVMADSSHVFLAPEGKHTADRGSLSMYPDDPGGLSEFPKKQPDAQGGSPKFLDSPLAKMFSGKGGGAPFKNPVPMEPSPLPGVQFEATPDQEQAAFTLPQSPQRAPPRPQMLSQMLGSRRPGGR